MCKLRRKKNLRREVKTYLTVYDFDVSCKQIIEMMESYIEQYGEDCSMDVCSYSDYCVDEYRFNVVYHSDETDEEYEKRCKEHAKKVAAKKKAKLDKEKRERAEYERLKKKFEKEN